jgi:hypothetical protein
MVIVFIMISKKMYRKSDIRNEQPWVVVDSKNYQIIREGSFFDLVESKEGNLMTKVFYEQLLSEINS